MLVASYAVMALTIGLRREHPVIAWGVLAASLVGVYAIRGTLRRWGRADITAGWRSPLFVPWIVQKIPSLSCGWMAVVLIMGGVSLDSWTAFFVWCGGMAVCEVVEALGARDDEPNEEAE